MNDSKTLIAAGTMLALGLVAGWGASRWFGDARHDAATDRPAVVSAPASAAGRPVLYWYDPMMPTQRFDQPGKSPFMDMQLVPKYADEAGAGSDTAGAVGVSPQARQSLGLRVAVAEKRAFANTVEAVGTVNLNEREIAIVQARANGFVERVYARAPGDVVAAGAPLVDLMHPEWLAAQQEFLAVRATGDAVLAGAARQRLALLGMPAALVERVERSGRPEAVNTVVAPVGGLIVELMVRQGMTVGQGMTLARLNGLGTVWVEAAVPEALAATVRPGQAAELRLTALPGEVLRGRVGALLAEANRDSRTMRVRVELPNPGGRLRAGMFAQVSLKGTAGAEAVVLPAEAVIRTGRRALVYLVDAPGRFRPVEVELGAEQDGLVVVRRGVAAGQQVVASGQFLIDSEASLQGLTTRLGAAPPVAAAAASAPPPAAVAVVEHETTGTVEAIEGGVVTLQHAAVPALKWPAMTMPFQLAQPGLAQGFKPGDRVRFRFRQQGDEAVVTALRRAGAAAADAHAGHEGAAASAGGKP